MKLVINNCYGGFSLSPKAVKWLADKAGKECYFFESNYEQEKHSYVLLEEGFPKGMFWTAFSTKNPTEENYDKCILTQRPDNRADPLLVQLVEELGDEASGDCAELKIVEIPDDVDYEIEEYDGKEWVAEKHRIWQ